MNPTFHIAAWLMSLTLLVGCVPSYDIIILNGTIYDGLSETPTQQDIAIRGERIVAIGDLDGKQAERVIDAEGLVVAPGFIDLHTHLDPLLHLPDAESHVRQGVTTALGGPDGSAPYPLKEYLDTLPGLGLGINVAFLAGHNTIRRNIMDLENRAPTAEELEAMKVQVQQAMDEGAFGLSTGLKYLPGAFSEVNEVIELSKVAARNGGIYTSHLREEGLGLIEAVEEAIRISAEAGIPVVLTHHKVVGKPMWGQSQRTLALVDSARAVGLDIMIDQYPYTASYTSISILIPAWAMAGGDEVFKTRLQDPVLRDSIKNGIVYNLVNDRGGADLRRVQFAKVSWKSNLEGRTLYDWAIEKGLDSTMQTGAELVMEAQTNGGASCVFFAMSDEDVDRIMLHPQTMIASDGRLVRPGEGHPHPRWYGTFPRVLGHYVRERGLLPLGLAIKKMTSMPAERLRLKDRGRIQEGAFADIVIFDPETVIDRATFFEPHQYPEGIPFVLVNGVFMVDDGNFTENRSGRVLYGPATKAKPSE